MTSKDIVIHYQITKIPETKADVPKIIQTVIHHVQIREIYFIYDPNFWQGVLIFGIKGFPQDQENFFLTVKDAISKLGGDLSIIKKEEEV